MKYFRLFIIVLSVVLCGSCKKNRFEIDKSKINQTIKIERFDKDIMSIDTTKLEAETARLQKKYGEFFTFYTQKVIGIGTPDSTDFYRLLKGFVTDSMAREIYKESHSYFNDISNIESELSTAFSYLNHYFPNIKTPKVLMHISGFNQNIVITENYLSLSVDYYLGADYIPYQYIAYDYQRYNMRKEKIVSDYILGFLMSEFTMQKHSDRLLENILYRGKILYLQSIIMPKQKADVLFGFTPEKMEWCKNNEKQMWTYILENKQLFTNDMLTVAKYLNEAPFTSFFGENSPGQAAIWIGYRIVKQYMDTNKNITLPQLMEETNYQKILEQSNYRP